MKKIDLNAKLKSVKNEDLPHEDDTLARALAHILTESNPPIGGIDAVKAWDWGLKLFSTGTLQIDRTDRDILVSGLKELRLKNLVSAQLRLALAVDFDAAE